MKYLEFYSIPFLSLKQGLHQYSFEIDDRFFKEFENSIVEKGRVEVQAKLDKQGDVSSLDFDFQGSVAVKCDRCDEFFDMNISGKESLLVKVNPADIEDEAEVMFIKPTESHLHLAQFMYEVLSLMIPIRKVHPKKEDGTDGCNPEIVQRIKGISEKPLKKTKEEKEVNPVWAQIKDELKSKNNKKK